nr:hypothetical protein [Angustibacter aerolatus]
MVGAEAWTAPRRRCSGTSLDFDKAASLRPDLILNVGFDADQKTYDTLKALAPTIEPPKGVKPYGVAWEQMTEPGVEGRRPRGGRREAHRRHQGAAHQDGRRQRVVQGPDVRHRQHQRVGPRLLHEDRHPLAGCCSRRGS